MDDGIWGARRKVARSPSGVARASLWRYWENLRLAPVADSRGTQSGMKPATIHPLPSGVARPRWSVMIPAHNHCDYLAETLRSVLAQDLGAVHMQLEVIDDASSEDVESVVRSIGKGRVDYFRQPRNIGQIGNFATCLQRSRG